MGLKFQNFPKIFYFPLNFFQKASYERLVSHLAVPEKNHYTPVNDRVFWNFLSLGNSKKFEKGQKKKVGKSRISPHYFVVLIGNSIKFALFSCKVLENQDFSLKTKASESRFTN